MAKPKGAMNKVTHVPGAPKKTHQGQGTRSKAKGTRKKTRGQGR